MKNVLDNSLINKIVLYCFDAIVKSLVSLEALLQVEIVLCGIHLFHCYEYTSSVYWRPYFYQTVSCFFPALHKT